MTVSCHCVAHRLALAMADAGKKVPYIKKFNDLLQLLYQYYDASPMRTAALRAIQVNITYTCSWNVLLFYISLLWYHVLNIVTFRNQSRTQFLSLKELLQLDGCHTTMPAQQCARLLQASSSA